MGVLIVVVVVYELAVVASVVVTTNLIVGAVALSACFSKLPLYNFTQFEACFRSKQASFSDR